MIGLGVFFTILATSAPAAASELKQALTQHGIQTIEPQVAASDFKLPTLQGSEIKLSDTAGRWVLLTFFATWCGADKSGYWRP